MLKNIDAFLWITTFMNTTKKRKKILVIYMKGDVFCRINLNTINGWKFQNIFFSKNPSRKFFLPTPLIPIILCSSTQYFYNINHNTLLKSVVHNKFTFHKVFLRSKKTATVVTFRACHGCDILIVIWSLRRSGLS